jgi:hypothetical protein
MATRNCIVSELSLPFTKLFYTYTEKNITLYPQFPSFLEHKKTYKELQCEISAIYHITEKKRLEPFHDRHQLACTSCSYYEESLFIP